jgi:hypothetical protein
MTVRLKPRDRNENWLLTKKPDEYARAGAMAEVIEREGARQAKMASKPVTTKAKILTEGPSGNSAIPPVLRVMRGSSRQPGPATRSSRRRASA